MPHRMSETPLGVGTLGNLTEQDAQALLREQPAVVHKDEHVTLWQGSSVEVLRLLPANSVDSILTTPIRDNRPIQRSAPHPTTNPATTWEVEALRVLKPGGHLLAFGGTRTWHRLAVTIEDAGFDIRDTLAWLHTATGEGVPDGRGAAATIAAFQPIVMGRKPLSGTVASNVLAHGTGALNIEASRTGLDGGSTIPSGMDRLNASNAIRGYRPDTYATGTPEIPAKSGRWPTNVLLDQSQAALLDTQSGQLTSGNVSAEGFTGPHSAKVYGKFARNELRPDVVYADTGGASRFFPTFNDHTNQPDGQPLNLLTWLIRLVTPPGGTNLDPFATTGATTMAALNAGFHHIAIISNPESAPTLISRLTSA